MTLDLQSDASTLRESVSERARRSLVFFARHALGLRAIPAERLLALEHGARPRLRFERDLLRRWHAFRAGKEVPPELRWAAGGGVA